MMMVYDSSQTPPRRLSDDTTKAVQEALRAYLEDSSEAAPLQHALVRAASEAHEKAILPEHLLVVLKDLWNALPEVRAMTEPSEQVQLLQRVVTISIKEYYRV